MISSYGQPHTSLIALAGALGVALALAVGWWGAAAAVVVVALAMLATFRDPARIPPSSRGLVVAPADGRVTSVHKVEFFEPLGCPARCVRIFLSLLDVHVNRSPCHGRVGTITRRAGKCLSALRPESPEVNEAVTMVLHHPITARPVAAVRQIAGVVARRIVCGVREGDLLQRGQRFGMIKLGSITEVYLPEDLLEEVRVQRGSRVLGGETVVAAVTPLPQRQRDAGGGSP